MVIIYLIIMVLKIIWDLEGDDLRGSCFWNCLREFKYYVFFFLIEKCIDFVVIF